MDKERTEANGWETNNENCPHCGVSLQGEPVPEKYLTHDEGCTGMVFRCRFHTQAPGTTICGYQRPGQAVCGLPVVAEPCLCFPYGKVTHFGRKVGVEIQGVYDGVLFWKCPDCSGTWHRWDDPAMRAKAERYMHP